RDDARRHVEDARVRAEGDVVVEAGVADVRGADTAADTGLVRREGLREPDRGDRGVVRLAAERARDPTRDVGVVDGEGALDAGAGYGAPADAAPRGDHRRAA